MAEHTADHQVALQLGRLDYEGRGVSPTAPHPELMDESARWALRITGDHADGRAASAWLASDSVYVRQSAIPPRRQRAGLPRTPWLHYAKKPSTKTGPRTLSRRTLGPAN